jgi:hypothetical protein
VLRELLALLEQRHLLAPRLIVEHPARVSHHVDDRAIRDEVGMDLLVVVVLQEDERLDLGRSVLVELEAEGGDLARRLGQQREVELLRDGFRQRGLAR